MRLICGEGQSVKRCPLPVHRIWTCDGRRNGAFFVIVGSFVHSFIRSVLRCRSSSARGLSRSESRLSNARQKCCINYTGPSPLAYFANTRRQPRSFYVVTPRRSGFIVPGTSPHCHLSHLNSAPASLSEILIFYIPVYFEYLGDPVQHLRRRSIAFGAVLEGRLRKR
jgi:hypothetical protein